MFGLFLQPLTIFDVVFMFGYDKIIEKRNLNLKNVNDSASHNGLSMGFIRKHNNPNNMVQ